MSEPAAAVDDDSINPVQQEQGDDIVSPHESYEAIKQMMELVDKGFLPAKTFATMQLQDCEIQKLINENPDNIKYEHQIAKFKINDQYKTILLPDYCQS